MKQRVQGKDRTLRKDASMLRPLDCTARHLHTALERIVSYCCGSRLVKSRKSDKGIFMPYRLLHVSDE
jgi:hypothetical protein